MRAGRELETLVAALEHCFAPGEAIITSPDHLPDRITGELREVDVSIRYTVGSVPLLIIIECRDRRASQDVTWIEQLAKKRDDLRAGRAVAVSATGFSQAAHTKAAHEGIALRTVAELSRTDVRSWCGVTHVEGRIRHAEPIHVSIELADSVDPTSATIAEALRSPDGRLNHHAVVFRSRASGAIMSFNKLWLAALEQHPEVLESVPPDGSQVEKTLSLDYDTTDRFVLLCADGEYEIVRFVVKATMWRENVLHPISRVLEYAGADGTRVQSVEFEIAVNQKEYVLAIYDDAVNERSGVTMRIRNGAVLESSDGDTRNRK